MVTPRVRALGRILAAIGFGKVAAPELGDGWVRWHWPPGWEIVTAPCGAIMRWTSR